MNEDIKYVKNQCQTLTLENYTNSESDMECLEFVTNLTEVPLEIPISWEDLT